jgi:hypothetical protein
MTTGRERYKKESKPKRKSIKFDLTKILVVLFFLSAIGYGVYTYVGFSKIKSVNPLRENNAEYYLLSSQKDALEKTLIVFEEKYNEKERIAMAYLYAENKEKGVSVLIYLPGWVEYSGLEKDFGSTLPISTFKYAGNFLQEGRGLEYALWQFEQVLGSNIDQYIWIGSDAFEIFKENLGESSGESIYGQYYSNGFQVNQEAFFLNSFVSKLGWINLLMSSSKFKDSEAMIYSSLPTLGNVILQLKQIHKGTISLRPYLIDFSSNAYLSQQESSSGVGISSYINTEAYDSIWRGFIDGMIDRDLEKERVRVEVYNGSGMSGYASQYARKIRNSGCEVVRYDNAPSEQEKTKFFVPKPDEFKNSLKVIFELFPSTYEIIEDRPSFMTTGDVVIILGKDIPTVYSF